MQIYRDADTNKERLGSPLLMLRAMNEAEALVRTRKTKPFQLDVRYVFIDSRQAHLDYLKNVVGQRDFSAPSISRIEFINDTFDNVGSKLVNRLQQHGRRHRVIFVLDQYGFKQVPMGLLKQIFGTFSNAEVILTFAADWIVDHLSNNEIWDRMLSEIGLCLEFSMQEIKHQNPTDWKRIIQLLLHKEIHRSSGALYYTPFFVESVEAHRAYWMIHLSNHPTARDVMMQLHWDHHNHFMHYGKAGLNMLGYTPKFDFEEQGFLTFGFDSQARQIAAETLMEDIPQRLHPMRDGVSVGDFLSNVANETPATRALLIDTVKELSLEWEVEIISRDGKTRSRGVNPEMTDIIRVPKQPKLRKAN